MFPHSDNSPSFAAKFLIDVSITHYISLNFLFPIFPVHRRHSTMFRTTMPKTSVNEDCEPLRGKCEIGLSHERKISFPARKMLFSKSGSKGGFCSLIAARFNARHDTGSFCWRNGVHVGYEITSTQDASNFSASNTSSLSSRGGFLIRIAKRCSGTFSIIVNCEPCGCHVKT